MGGLVARLGRTLIVLGLGIVLLGCGWVAALVVAYGASLSHWALAPALFIVGTLPGRRQAAGRTRWSGTSWSRP